LYEFLTAYLTHKLALNVARLQLSWAISLMALCLF